MNETLGTTLLVAILFTTSAGITALIMVQSPEDVIHAEFALVLDRGATAWGDGDDRVLLLHKGGEALSDDAVRFRFDIDGAVVAVEGAALHYPGGPFEDGRFRIGETWALTVPIGVGDPVSVEVMTRSQSGTSTTSGGLVQRVAWSASATASTLSCKNDALAPWDRGWVLVPADVTSGTTGNVTATVGFVDDCSGIDPASAPVLQYRIPGGTVADWTVMSDLALFPSSTHVWQARIPEPPGGWAGASALDLEYRASVLPADLNGNQLGGAGTTRTQHIDDLAAPIAAFVASCNDLACSFNASASAAAVGRMIALYSWDHGDGTNADTVTPTTDHTFGAAGTYTITLLVTDSAGSTDVVSEQVAVASDLHVHHMDHVKKGASRAESHVRIYDAAEAPVSGVAVSATVCKATGTCVALSGTTDADGDVVLVYGPPGGGAGTYTTCVDTVALDGFIYDPNDDHATGGFKDAGGKTCLTEVI